MRAEGRASFKVRGMLLTRVREAIPLALFRLRSFFRCSGSKLVVRAVQLETEDLEGSLLQSSMSVILSECCTLASDTYCTLAASRTFSVLVPDQKTSNAQPRLFPSSHSSSQNRGQGRRGAQRGRGGPIRCSMGQNASHTGRRIPIFRMHFLMRMLRVEIFALVAAMPVTTQGGA